MFSSIFTDVIPCGSISGYVHPPAPELEVLFLNLVDKSVLEFASLLQLFDIFPDEALVEFLVVIWWQEYRFEFFILYVCM